MSYGRRHKADAPAAAAGQRTAPADVWRGLAILLFAAIVLTEVAWTRAPEYDEAYSIFLTAGDARPAWPSGIFWAGDVRGLYVAHAGFMRIANDLRAGDVHPPLYFWALEAWRWLFGPSWFAARMLSVVFAVAALASLGWLAELAEIPPAPAMLVALLAYGFAYTGIVARGFALAQLLDVVGTTCVFFGLRSGKQSMAFASGVAFGAASFTNYLTIFTGLATLFWLAVARSRRRLLPFAVLGVLLFLPFDAWFFLAQRGSRIGQFVAFSWWHALPLLAKDTGAAMFGGLPVYAGAFAIPVTLSLAALVILCAGFIIRAWRPPFALFGLAAAATPVGLLALGLIFHSTPIEIRYLAFATPFIALLAAAALPRAVLAVLTAVEACAVIGLAFAPATMQPQGAAAAAAARLATSKTLVLLPFGNDGVGIPGPFIAAAPDSLRLLLLRAAMPKLSGENSVILPKVAADDTSRAAITQAESYFRNNPCWRPQQQTKLLTLYLNCCPQQQP